MDQCYVTVVNKTSEWPKDILLLFGMHIPRSQLKNLDVISEKIFSNRGSWFAVNVM